jgi:peptidoglycan/LPS O-acetylase OafA/YrhL
LVAAPPRRDGIAFRPALDGARALAVVAVLLYHAGVPGTRGGFLGVDLFFVLSGFLITSLLLVEYRTHGKISLPRFWWRRARRLLPAMFAVVLFVSWFALTRAPDVLHARLRGDLLSVVFYVANWRFIVDEVSYFERFADPNPLLHMWSLAIEEQFYLLWPVLLLLLVGPLRRRFGHRTLLVTTLTMAAASTTWMALLHSRGESLTRLYYGTDTRAAALLVGALIARHAVNNRWWEPRSGPGPWQPRWLEPVGWLCLAGLVLAFIAVDEQAGWLYRGGFLLIAVIAAGFLLPLSHPTPTALSRLLTITPLRWIGERSYGLYLWHWPIYVLLSGPRTGLSGGALLVVRLAATFAVAALCYRYVELPWRRGRFSSIGSRGILEVVLRRMVPALVVVVAVVFATTLPRPTSTEPVAAVVDPGPSGPTLSVFMYGDSVSYGLHTQHRPDARLNLSVTGATRLSCFTVVGETVSVDGKAQDQPEHCATWPEQFRKGAATRHDLGIVMPGNGELYDHVVGSQTITYATPAYREHLTSWLDRTFATLRPTTSRLAITTVPCYARPEFGVDIKDKVINEPRRADWLNSVIRDYVSAHPDIELYDWTEAICPSGKFAKVVDGIELREDGVHFTPDGATWAWRWLASAIRERP